MSLTRRAFVKSTAAAGLARPALGPSLVRVASPNAMLNHAAIGVGGKGWSDLLSFATSGKVNVAAICDVDLSRRRRIARTQKSLLLI